MKSDISRLDPLTLLMGIVAGYLLIRAVIIEGAGVA